MIYLVGVDHQVQHQRGTQISIFFEFYLSRKVEELKIDLLAEEWFEELLPENSVKTTVTQDVASKYGIAHIFCDPNKSERRNIGWYSKSDDHLREAFWLSKIKAQAKKNIIFICGSDHLESFTKLINNSGFKVTILPKRFDIVTYLKSENRDL